MIEFLLLLAVGVGVGIFGTIVGVGGGFIIVPLLLLVYKVPPQYAVGTSLCIVALNALSGSVSYARQKRIDYRTGVLFASAAIPGAIGGAWLIDRVTGPTFDVAFGVFLIAMAAYIAAKPSGKSDGGASQSRPVFDPAHPVVYSVPSGMFVSCGVGFLSSVAGIGGGIVHVPAMIYLFNFPTAIAVSTSHFILAISATAGSASHISLGHILWDKLPPLGIGVVAGAQIGGAVSHKIRSHLVVRGLAVAVLLVALRLISRHV